MISNSTEMMEELMAGTWNTWGEAGTQFIVGFVLLILLSCFVLKKFHTHFRHEIPITFPQSCVKMVAEEENTEDHIHGELYLSIKKLQEIQDELDKINEEESYKVQEIEQNYKEVRKPVYDKRSEVLKAIPCFWLTAFLSHRGLRDLLNEEDQKIFRHMTSLEVEDFKDVESEGYSITFNFSPNLYFEDTKLTKNFTFLDEGTTKITSTNIKWKEGKGIPNGEKESFFRWFNEREDIGEINYEIAEIIKEYLWRNPLTYFGDDADDSEDDDQEDGEED